MVLSLEEFLRSHKDSNKLSLNIEGIDAEGELKATICDKSNKTDHITVVIKENVCKVI